LALTGNNTNTGGTTITAGTLQVGNATASGTLGTGAVTNNSVLVLDRSDNGLTGTGSLANAISGGGSLINNGTGTVTLSGVNSYSGGTVLNAGLLQADNATNGMGSAISQEAFLSRPAASSLLAMPALVMAPGPQSEPSRWLRLLSRPTPS